jgi:hypothetical protein
MPRGGKRPGAGRKPGAATKKTREIANRVIRGEPIEPSAEAKAGVPNTPLEVMLANMRHAFAVALDAEKILGALSPADLVGDDPQEQFKFLLAEVKKTVDLRQVAQECARDAAPFVHARLAPVDGRAGKDEEAVPLHERLKAYARKDAIDSSAGKVVEIKKARGK